MLVTTKEASKATGLSEWELRRGFKEGIYPAILIGRGEQARRLRWDLDQLKDAIKAISIERDLNPVKVDVLPSEEEEKLSNQKKEIKPVKPQSVIEYIRNRGWSFSIKKIISFVYFISDGEFIKIGKAEEPYKRMAQLQAANPRKLFIVCTIPIMKPRNSTSISYLGSNCALDVELFLHKMFSNYRVNGEWFDLRGAINLNEWGEYFGKIDRTGEKSDIEYIEIRDRREAANDMND